MRTGPSLHLAPKEAQLGHKSVQSVGGGVTPTNTDNIVHYRQPIYLNLPAWGGNALSQVAISS